MAPYKHEVKAKVFSTSIVVPKCSRPILLNREEPIHRTGSPLTPAGTTLLEILGVVRRDDFFARLRVVHLGVVVWEEAIETPVEDAGSEEGVGVADVKTVQIGVLAYLQHCGTRC